MQQWGELSLRPFSHVPSVEQTGEWVADRLVSQLFPQFKVREGQRNAFGQSDGEFLLRLREIIFGCAQLQQAESFPVRRQWHTVKRALLQVAKVLAKRMVLLSRP